MTDYPARGTELVESPSMVTFVWPGPGGLQTGTCHMPWRNGQTVKHYLHQEPLRKQSLLGMWKKCKAYNRDKLKVKLSYVPKPGDAVVIVRVRGRG